MSEKARTDSSIKSTDQGKLFFAAKSDDPHDQKECRTGKYK